MQEQVTKQPTGLIFDIQRFSIHDGPGIRTTVFLKGCPLDCVWCHNPESKSGSPQIAFYAAKCIECGGCGTSCPREAITPTDERVDRTKCHVCGACARACSAEALQVVGWTATVSEVVETVMRDEPFYKTSGGGVTLSGGEPLKQYEFSAALLKALKENGLHTAVDTCGLAPWDKVQGIAALTDLFLYDIKLIDPDKHKGFCGADNSTILENARKLAASGAEIVFRTAIIPGLNDTAEDLKLLAGFVTSLPGNPELELLPYHHIASGKYEALGMTYRLPDLEPLDNLDEHKNTLQKTGVRLAAEPE